MRQTLPATLARLRGRVRPVSWPTSIITKRTLSDTSATTGNDFSSSKGVLVTHHVHGNNSSSSNNYYYPSTSSAVSPLDLDRQTLTNQVDALLRETRQLMGRNNNSSSKEEEENDDDNGDGGDGEETIIPHHLIAFSGGVDSSLTAALVHGVHDSKVERVQAVLGLSAAVPAEQVELATRVADQLGVEFVKVATTEGEDATYLANAGQACLACKTHLYSTLQAIVQHGNDNAHNESSFRLYNGTNADDLQDDTRLGLIAAREFHVASPLRHLTKATVRQVARHLGLLNWNYAASPCLRSRLALGVTATAQHLQLMAQAERLVRQRLGAELVDETTNLRVRLLAGHCVRIEIDECVLPETLAQDWTELQTMGGFQDVTVRAFKSGSVARTEEPSETVVQGEEEERPVVVGFA